MKISIRIRYPFQLAAIAAALLAPVPAPAQAGTAQVPAIAPRQWAMDAATGELHDLQYQGSYLRYRSHIVDAKGDQVRDVIESRDGTVARLLYRDGHPLIPEEDTAERSRLQAMLDSPQEFARHIRNDQTGRMRAADIVKLLPVAMVFTYTEGQPQRKRAVTGPVQEPEIVLDFAPDPKWPPPSMLSEALTGIRGRVWIDASTHHMMRLEATVFQPINVGFGVFAKVFPGGVIELDQAHPNEQRWIYSHYVQRITLRALMVKTIRQNSEVRSSDFTQVAAMSYQEAIKILLATPLPSH